MSGGRQTRDWACSWLDYAAAQSDSAFHSILRHYKTVNMILIQETYVVWKRKMDLHEAGGC